MVPKIENLCPALFNAVKKAHEEAGTTGTGHEFNHDRTVSQLAINFALDDDIRVAMLAGAAGLCHSADWILTEKNQLGKSGNISKVSRGEASDFVSSLLSLNTDFSESERHRIIDAVVNHGKRNEPDDDPVLVALTDADRVANMGLCVAIRAGQHNRGCQPFDPVYIEWDPRNLSPAEKYAHPISILWDIANCASWADPASPYTLRLPKAREEGRRRAEELRNFVETIRSQQVRMDLIPD